MNFTNLLKLGRKIIIKFNAKSSNKKSIEDLENQLLLKNKNLNEKYLEIETLLDLTNTINSLDDLESLFFNVLTLSSSIINSSKG